MRRERGANQFASLSIPPGILKEEWLPPLQGCQESAVSDTPVMGKPIPAGKRSDSAKRELAGSQCHKRTHQNKMS